MIRRTITVPDDVDREVSELVARGEVRTLSRFFQDAARRELAARRAERLVQEAARLDPEEEVATARATRRGRGRAPWGRLR